MPYAERTRVPIEQTKTEIERTLTRYGADRFAYFTEAGMALIIFEAHDRRLKFTLPLPTGGSGKDDALRRRKWRALLLCIKAKLEAVESKIESFEEAFLSHVILPDGSTVGEATRGTIAAVYKSGQMAPLLAPPQSKGDVHGKDASR